MVFEYPSYVTLKKDTHQYFSADGEEYRSVSKCLGLIKEEFDREGISRNMAKGKAAQLGISVDRAQEMILAEWESKKDNASDIGNHIHDNLEAYFTIGKCDSDVMPAALSIMDLVKDHHRVYPEQVVYSKRHKIAGMIDLPTARTRSKSSPIDIFDYKTNVEKGIELDTRQIKNGKFVKFFSQFLLPPVDHLEACNFNIYSLQMSLYGVMVEMVTGRRIGRLGIIFIDYKTMQTTLYPVPYLKLEALAIMDHVAGVKSLPQKKRELQDASWDLNE